MVWVGLAMVADGYDEFLPPKHRNEKGMAKHQLQPELTLLKCM